MWNYDIGRTLIVPLCDIQNFDVQVLDIPGTTSTAIDVASQFKRLCLAAGLVVFLTEFRGSPDSSTIEEYKSICEQTNNCPTLVCLTQVGLLAQSEM